MRPLPPLPFPDSRAPVTRVTSLIAAGVPVKRLYASDKSRALHGVVTAPGIDPTAFMTRVAAARLLMSDGAFLSKRTAARLWGLPVNGGELEIDVGAVRPAKPPQRKEFRQHQIRAGTLLEVPGAPLWLPHPVDIWAMLAADLLLEDLVTVGDCIVSGRSRRERPLASLELLSHAVERHRGARGIDRLRLALPLLRTGVESPAESRLRLVIVNAGLPEPTTSCPADTELRRFHADLGYPELKIAIEYEGEYHFTGGADQARLDLRRHDAMHDAGWIVLRVTVLDLRDPYRFLARLTAALRQRAK